MDYDLMWLIAGFVLVIVELVTGSFYLLVLGVGAFAGALVAYFKLGFWMQAMAAAMVTIAGVMWVRTRPRDLEDAPMASLDVGQLASFESWSNQAAGSARVRYRDTQWDAKIEGDAGSPVHGDPFYILSVEGSTLRITRNRP